MISRGEIYTALVIVIFITTLLPPLLLRRSYLNEPARVSPDAVIKLLFPDSLLDLEGPLEAPAGPESRSAGEKEDREDQEDDEETGAEFTKDKAETTDNQRQETTRIAIPTKARVRAYRKP